MAQKQGSDPTLTLLRRPIRTRTLQPDASQDAVLAARGRVAVYGGPGSGKSSTLIRAAIDRVQDGLDPS